MSLLHARGLSVRFGKKVILDGASFTFGAHDRVGLIGPNGSGKSTLMKVLAGAREADAGEVQMVRRARAGYLPQEMGEMPDGPLIDGVLASVPGRRALEQRIEEIERQLANPSELQRENFVDTTGADRDRASSASDRSEEIQLELAGELATLHEELAHHEEHYGRHKAEEILLGLGFKTAQLSQPAKSLSGGWRMRATLSGLLLQDPELLLLDEPTNHLDVPTLEWFDAFLKRSRKALLLVSHDREFLDRQIDRVLSLEVDGLRSYKGDYESYLVQRADELELLEARANKQEKRHEEIMAFVNRFRAKATKAKAAQSKLRALEKEEKIERIEERKTVQFRFPPAPRSGREVIELRQVSKRFGDNVVYQRLDGQVLRGERIAIVGLNGTGKTTLLKLVAGELEQDSGEVALGHNVELGYFAQHHAEALAREKTVLEEVHALVPTQPQSWVRSILGSFLFTGDDVDKKIAVLSGGERARVALAKLLVVPSNLLLLDEPTNHLDLDSSEALIEALSGYDGTLLFVSHNRSFVNGLATQVWEVKDGRIDPQPGNLDDWERRRAEEKARLAALAAAARAGEDAKGGEKESSGQGKDARRERAVERERKSKLLGPLKKEIVKIEEQIAALEKEKKEAEALLADPALFADAARSTPLVARYRKAEAELETLFERWTEKSDEMSRAEAAL